MSAEPAADRAGHIIPQGILESSIKITNEPPTGMLANLHKALDNFSQVNTKYMAKSEREGQCGGALFLNIPCQHKHVDYLLILLA